MIEQITTLIGAVGAIAFVVSVITQVLKGVKPLDKLPTDILVFILSIALTLVAFFAYASYVELAILWYHVVGAVIGGFIVALGTTPQAKIYNKDGSFKKATDGLKFIPTGAFQQAAQVEKKINPKTGAYEGYGRSSSKNTGVFHGYVEMTEEELDNSGLLDDRTMNDLIVPYEGKDAKGKSVTLYRVPAQVEADLSNEGFRTRYNAASKLTNKQMDALAPMSQMDKPSQVIQNGVVYTYNQQTGQYE